METDVPGGENPKREVKLRGTVSDNSCSQPLPPAFLSAYPLEGSMV